MWCSPAVALLAFKPIVTPRAWTLWPSVSIIRGHTAWYVQIDFWLLTFPFLAFAGTLSG